MLSSFRYVGKTYTATLLLDPMAEPEDLQGNPRVAFQISSSNFVQPPQTRQWQWGLAVVLGLFTLGTAFQLGLTANVSTLPKVSCHCLSALLIEVWSHFQRSSVSEQKVERGIYRREEKSKRDMKSSLRRRVSINCRCIRSNICKIWVPHSPPCIVRDWILDGRDLAWKDYGSYLTFWSKTIKFNISSFWYRTIRIWTLG